MNTCTLSSRSSRPNSSQSTMTFSRISWSPTKSRISKTQKYSYCYIVDHDKREIDERSALILPRQHNWRAQLIPIILKTRRHPRLAPALDEHLENPQEPHKLQKETSKDILVNRVKLIKIIRSSVRLIHRQNHPVGQLPLRFYPRSDAHGNGG